jgi:AcrR family transcriptional regulator
VNPTKRSPSQSRGLERYDSILDAYSTLICERSDIHVPIQAIAQAAGASVGSLYHFFGGREAIIDALAQRHVDRIAVILHSVQEVSEAEWKDYSSTQVIEKLIGPTLDYFSRHRDVYIIAMTLPNRSEFSEHGIPAQILQLHQRVLRIKCPLFTQDQVELHSKVIFKLPSGLIDVFSAHPDLRLLDQAKIACSAYLTEISKS